MDGKNEELLELADYKGLRNFWYCIIPFFNLHNRGVSFKVVRCYSPHDAPYRFATQESANIAIRLLGNAKLRQIFGV